MRFNFPGALKAVLEACKITGAETVRSIGAIGYETGAGGVVTQATDKTTAVTLNKLCGTITLHAQSLAAAAETGFTLTNSTIAATDVVVANIKGVGTVNSYQLTVDGVANGSCHITLANLSAGALAEALTINFAVIKSVAA
jgi:hypothetical protein